MSVQSWKNILERHKSQQCFAIAYLCIKNLPRYDREAAESRLRNLEAELHVREAAFNNSLKEQVERARSGSDTRSAILVLGFLQSVVI